jgi:hypothetical protein
MAIIIPIGVDTSGLRKLNTAGAKLRALGKVAAVAAGAAALGGLVKTIQIGTDEFMEQQKVVAQTNAVLKSTGGVANVTAKEMGRLSEQLMRKSGVDDEAIQSGQNLLLTFTKIRNETGKNNDIFDQATKATLDLSVAMGKDMSSSAILVGKALNDPVKGATALTRAGIQLTEGQKNQIKAFVESGRVLEAQKIILRELNTQFGGSAEAAGKTLPGQLNILKQTFSNLAGELVSRFLPGIATAATRLTNFISQFAKQPTLRAKVDFVIGTFDKLMWSGIQSISNWWSKPKVAFEDNPANRLRVTIQPAGQDQVASWFRDFKNKMIAEAGVAGQGIGVALANAIFGGVSQGTRKRRGDIIADIGYLYSGAWVFEAGANLATNLWTGFSSRMRELGKGFPDLFRSILDLYNPFEAGKRIGGLLKDGFNREVRRGGSTGLSNVMTKAVKDAVQAARQGLAGAGAALGGTLATVLGATFTRPGGMAPAAITAEERAIEDKRLELEEARLKEAAASVEATEEDKLALREFYLNKEKILRDRALSQEIDTRQRGINNLIESFNQGLIGATQFESQLRALIGSDLGSELGIGFAGAFERELTGILNIVKDIASIAGAPTISAAGAGDISSTLKGENQRRFSEALSTWEKNRKKRLDQATDFRKRKESEEGSKITDAERKEITAIMQKWDRENPKPNRAAYGLALGGILKKQVFTAGEAGPEAVMPLTGRGGEMLRDALGLNNGGASRGDIYLTVNAGLGTNPDELSRVIVDSIKRYERRNGQVFSGPLVAATSTAAGVTSTTSGDFNFLRAARRG